MKIHSEEQGLRIKEVTPEAMAVLIAYSWPGNIRELENEVERLLVLGSDLETLPLELVSGRIREAVGSGGLSIYAFARATGNLNDAVEQLEREMIHQGLIRTGNNKSQLARELGISRSNLILKISKYGLDKMAAGGEGDGGPEASA